MSSCVVLRRRRFLVFKSTSVIVSSSSPYCDRNEPIYRSSSYSTPYATHHRQRRIARRTYGPRQHSSMPLNNSSNNYLALSSYSNSRGRRQQRRGHRVARWLTSPASGYMCQCLLLLPPYIYSLKKKRNAPTKSASSWIKGRL